MGDVFKALADPTRRRILDELTERDGQTLFEICSRLATKHHLGSSRQAISQHLEVLEAAGLIQATREGRFKSDEVAALLDGHPHLMAPGASIEVLECMQIPGT